MKLLNLATARKITATHNQPWPRERYAAQRGAPRGRVVPRSGPTVHRGTPAQRAQQILRLIADYLRSASANLTDYKASWLLGYVARGLDTGDVNLVPFAHEFLQNLSSNHAAGRPDVWGLSSGAARQLRQLEHELWALAPQLGIPHSRFPR